MDEKKKQQYFNKYLEKDTWTENEVVSLLHGVPLEQIVFAKFLKRTTYSETREELDASVSLGILNRNMLLSYRLYGRVGDDCYVYRSKEIIEWAKDKKNTYPNFSFRDIENAKESEKSEIFQPGQIEISGDIRDKNKRCPFTGGWKAAAYEKAVELGYPEKIKQDAAAMEIAEYLKL